MIKYFGPIIDKYNPVVDQTENWLGVAENGGDQNKGEEKEGGMRNTLDVLSRLFYTGEECFIGMLN